MLGLKVCATARQILLGFGLGLLQLFSQVAETVAWGHPSFQDATILRYQKVLSKAFLLLSSQILPATHKTVDWSRVKDRAPVRTRSTGTRTR